MFLLIPKWRLNPSRLCDRMNIDATRLSEILKTLEDLSIVEVKNGNYVLLKDQVHLPKSNVLCTPQQNLLRMLAFEKLQRNSNNAFNFLATFAADEKTKTEIQKQFMVFLKNVESLVEKAPNEEVYHFQFDVFGW